MPERRSPLGSADVTALVVDDDAAVRGAVTEALASLGCRGLQADSFDEAVRAFRTVRVHFSILDVHLGDRTGFDVLREIRLTAVSHPAIFMSGAFTIEMRARAIQLDPFRVLAKPLILGELRDAVGSLLRSGRLTTPDGRPIA